MNRPAKLILRWDIEPQSESEYFEFMVSDFIPGTSRLGLSDVQAWYTLYGDCEQILFTAIAGSQDQMQRILQSETWEKLQDRLGGLVTNFSQKVIDDATGGFQF
jgi:hypothetical protein